jgi:hypothetical protein
VRIPYIKIRKLWHSHSSYRMQFTVWRQPLYADLACGRLWIQVGLK